MSFTAEDTELGRFVALNFLPEPLAGDPHAVERFGREARAASSPYHPDDTTTERTNRSDDVGFGLECEKPFDSSLEIGSRGGLPWGVRPV